MMEANITYLYNSGFCMELECANIIMDYYSSGFENLPEKIQYILADDKPVYVLSSHAHADHFDRSILGFTKENSNITYILSSDIGVTKVSGAKGVISLGVGDTFADKVISIRAFGSTDEGVSFLFKINGKSFFHAGDLNNWHWSEEADETYMNDMEENFLNIVSDIKSKTSKIDLAIFPIDPRMGENYSLGAKQFLEAIKVEHLVPMHFRETPEKMEDFRKTALKYGANFYTFSKREEVVGVTI